MSLLKQYVQSVERLIQQQLFWEMHVFQHGNAFLEIPYIAPDVCIATHDGFRAILHDGPGQQTFEDDTIFSRAVRTQGAVIEFQCHPVVDSGLYHFLDVYGIAGVVRMADDLDPRISHGANDGARIVFHAAAFDAGGVKAGNHVVQVFHTASQTKSS